MTFRACAHHTTQHALRYCFKCVSTHEKPHRPSVAIEATATGRPYHAMRKNRANYTPPQQCNGGEANTSAK